MSHKNFGFGTQIRKSPYFDSTVKWGATGFSVYNHMYIPRDFGSPEQNFWNLIEKSILCDVAVERQVEITGPDAYKFIQLLTPRDLSKLSIGQCKYVLIVNNDGGILNDPVLLRLAEKYKKEGMSAYSRIQQQEFAREKDGYTSVKHQREVGTSYFDAVSNTISSGQSSTTAMAGSTESEQF